MNLIKISTDLELSVHEFPTGTHEEQNNKLRELIGNDCRLYEHVMPKRLYTELHQMDHYYNLAMPPIYDWKNGYLCGTHPWPARQWTGSTENAWSEIYEIDSSIVIEAAEYFESAKAFLKTIK